MDQVIVRHNRSMHAIAKLLASPPHLPVAQLLDAIVHAAHTGAAVVQAPPGTGKTTLVPPLVAQILGARGGRVIVTQPRRVAARAAARRLSALLGERLGDTAGFTVRGDSARSSHTHIEFVTPGVLVARLQRDPELKGVGAIIFDEVHERHLDNDLALAFALDARDTIREDLLVIAMSATVEAGRTARLLSPGGAPIVEIPGAIHPLDVRYAPPPRGAEPFGPGTSAVQRAFLDHVAATVRRALTEAEGDILAFLPGIREVNYVASAVSGAGTVVPLHGSLSHAQQDRALFSAGHERRIVVSTSLAESSVTVPGVRIVVDAGLSREPRMNYSRGIGGLVTIRESQAAAIQRAGRAGRTGPGVVYRCFDQATWARMAPHSEPEIRNSDLTDFTLQVACWGAPRAHGLALLDPPPEPALDAATATLTALGALDEGMPTPLGRALATIPLNPRLARSLLLTAQLVGAHDAGKICALIDEAGQVPGADLARATAAEHSEARRLERIAKTLTDVSPSVPLPVPQTREQALGAGVALAYPDRIAHARCEATDEHHPSRRYLLANGAGATLPAASPLSGHTWLAVAQVDRAQGSADSLIRAAVPIEKDAALAYASPLLHEETEVSLHSRRLRSRLIHYLGAIEISAGEYTTPLAADARSWIQRQIHAGKLPFTWSKNAAALRLRLAFLYRTFGEPWPDMSDAVLDARLDEWAGPELEQFARGKPLPPIGASQIARILPWPEASQLDELAPEYVELPSGRRARIEYGSENPSIRIRLQDAFGWATNPRIALGRVVLTLVLLSPAQRPLAVTSDLASFWAGPYAQVRAEMRGRYVKHPWPKDPLHPLEQRAKSEPQPGDY
jgi:ATP-dependent helicase HrpB